MSDARFEIEQVLKLRQEGGSAAAELNKTAAAVKQLTDESARYQATLQKVADTAKEQADADAYAALKAEILAKNQEAKRVVMEETVYAQSELKNLTKTYTAAEVEMITSGKKGLAELGEATDKVFTSKKQLKDMVKQLGHEFPLLGQIGRLALNPIAFTTAGITAAFVIWKYRTDELVKSLGGVEMPDFKEGDVERINRVAEAYKTLAEKMLAAGTNAERVTKQLELANKVIEANDALKKAFGLETGTAADAAKASQLQLAANALNTSGKGKLAAAGRFNPNNPFASDLEKAATDAEAEKVKSQSRMADIEKGKNLGAFDPRRLFYDNQFRARYGYGATYDDATKREQGNLDVQETVIGRYRNRKTQGAMSDALRASGEKDIAGRDDLTQKLYEVLTKIANQQATGGVEKLASFSPGAGSLAELVTQTGDLASGVALLAQANANMKKANQVLQQIVNNNNQR